jgi:hypothetical protein
VPDAKRFTVNFFAVGNQQPARKMLALIADTFSQDLPQVRGQKMMWKQKGA